MFSPILEESRLPGIDNSRQAIDLLLLEAAHHGPELAPHVELVAEQLHVFLVLVQRPQQHGDDRNHLRQFVKFPFSQVSKV